METQNKVPAALQNSYVRFKSPQVGIDIAVFWNVTPCCLTIFFPFSLWEAVPGVECPVIYILTVDATDHDFLKRRQNVQSIRTSDCRRRCNARL
jgi:hypothetical protein